MNACPLAKPQVAFGMGFVSGAALGTAAGLALAAAGVVWTLAELQQEKKR